MKTSSSRVNRCKSTRRVLDPREVPGMCNRRRDSRESRRLGEQVLGGGDDITKA